MQTLNLSPATPGQFYQFEVPVTGFSRQPVAEAGLKIVPGGRALQNEVLISVQNNTSHPTAWRLLVTVAIMPKTPVWVEVYLNEQLYATGWLKPKQTT